MGGWVARWVAECLGAPVHQAAIQPTPSDARGAVRPLHHACAASVLLPATAHPAWRVARSCQWRRRSCCAAAANGMAAWVNKKLGGSPLQGVDEPLWLRWYLERRRWVLLNTDSAWEESVQRVQVYQWLVQVRRLGAGWGGAGVVLGWCWGGAGCAALVLVLVLGVLGWC